MREYLVTVLLAAVITYLITPLVRDLAIKAGAVTAIRSEVHQLTKKFPVYPEPKN